MTCEPILKLDYPKLIISNSFIVYKITDFSDNTLNVITLPDLVPNLQKPVALLQCSSSLWKQAPVADVRDGEQKHIAMKRF